MKFREIASRLTGFSVPIFGVSWDPPEPEVNSARRVVTFLEDRRVLYVPASVETPEHCVASVLEIRRFLTHEIAQLGDGSALAPSFRAMRSACRKFLTSVGPLDSDIVRFGAHPGHYASWTFIGALGELRGVIGVHVARIAAQHGLDVDDELGQILPAEDRADAS